MCEKRPFCCIFFSAFTCVNSLLKYLFKFSELFSIANDKIYFTFFKFYQFEYKNNKMFNNLEFYCLLNNILYNGA